MTKLLTLEVPGLPPTVNSMYRNSGTHRYKREEVTEWQEETAALMAENYSGRSPPFTGRVSVVIEFVVKTRKTWDIDNRLKALLDCLEIAGVIENDNQIDSLNVTRKRGGETLTRLTLADYKGGLCDDE